MESRSMRLSVILLVSLLVVGTLLLAACDGGSTTTTAAPSTQTSGTSTSQSTGSTDTSGTTATSAALTPKPGGTLRIAAQAIGANIGWPATMTASGVLVQSYYETLLHSDEKGNLIPWLAESYKVADDQKSITFTIRKGVKFSDGSDLTAEVVKWNLEQQLTLAGGRTPGGRSRRAPPAGAPPPGAPPAGALPPGLLPLALPPGLLPPAIFPPVAPPAGGAITPMPGFGGSNWTSVEVVDPYTVRVNFNTWDNSIPASFGDSNPALYMVSKAAYDKNGQDWMTTHPVGTGAFTVASYATDATYEAGEEPELLGHGCTGQQAAVPGRDWITPSRLTPRPR